LIEGLFGYTIAGGKAVDRAVDRAVDGREVDRTVSWDSGLGQWVGTVAETTDGEGQGQDMKNKDKA
jgi:hypothetical protein